jgi:hypothetical protein
MALRNSKVCCIAALYRIGAPRLQCRNYIAANGGQFTPPPVITAEEKKAAEEKARKEAAEAKAKARKRKEVEEAVRKAKQEQEQKEAEAAQKEVAAAKAKKEAEEKKAAEEKAKKAAEEKASAIPPEQLVGRRVSVQLKAPALSCRGDLHAPVQAAVVASQTKGRIFGLGASRHTLLLDGEGGVGGKQKLVLQRPGKIGCVFQFSDGPPVDEAVFAALQLRSSSAGAGSGAAGAGAGVGAASSAPTARLSIEEVRELVGPRLQQVKVRFPTATHDDLCGALLTYSPESALFAKGHKSSEAIPDGQWDKYQGELQYGSYSSFHNGVKEVIGEEVADEKALAAIHTEIMRDGVPEEDRYNLWYVQHCEAVEQPNYDEKGQERQDERGQQKILDQGHGGMRLRDFVARANAELQRSGSRKRVTDAQVRRATRTVNCLPIKH